MFFCFCFFAGEGVDDDTWQYMDYEFYYSCLYIHKHCAVGELNHNILASLSHNMQHQHVATYSLLSHLISAWLTNAHNAMFAWEFIIL